MHVGFGFDPSGGRPPTEDRPQSKLWYTDGTWWGVLLAETTNAFHIHRLDADSQAWIDTGTLIDDRIAARADALWDGSHLYAISAGTTPSPADHVRVMRYSYNPLSREYALDANFPVQLTQRGARHVSIAKDSTEKLWATFILDDRVIVNHSFGADHLWGPGLVLHDAEAGARPAGSAALQPYADRIGVIWTVQTDGAIYFASHADGDAEQSWSGTTTVAEGTRLADDHIGAASLDGPLGTQVFVVVKTSLDVLPDADPHEPQILLLQMQPDGTWQRHVFSLLEDHHTRPVLVIDEDRRDLYVFAVTGSGSVFYKRSAADEVFWSPGRGAPFIVSEEHQSVTSPTSTKQNVNAESGIVVLATDEETSRYLHGTMSLDDG